MVKSGKISIFPSIALSPCLFISEFWKEHKANNLFFSHFLLVSIFSCGPDATSLLFKVQMKQTLLLFSVRRQRA